MGIIAKLLFLFDMKDNFSDNTISINITKMATINALVIRPYDKKSVIADMVYFFDERFMCGVFKKNNVVVTELVKLPQKQYIIFVFVKGI